MHHDDKAEAVRLPKEPLTPLVLSGGRVSRDRERVKESLDRIEKIDSMLRPVRYRFLCIPVEAQVLKIVEDVHAVGF